MAAAENAFSDLSTFFAENPALLAQYALQERAGVTFAPNLEDLAEARWESFMDMLRDTMPSNSIILDMWDWDWHFEDELDGHQLLGALFGGEDSIEECAQEIAGQFKECVEHFDLDYDQHTDPEALAERIQEEAKQFVIGWREAAREKLLVEGQRSAS